MKKWFRKMAVLLAAAMMLAASPVIAMADTLSPVKTNNVGVQNYTRWAAPVRSYLADRGGGSLTRLEYTGTQLVAETYDADRKLAQQKKINMELPLFGGFYAGTDSYFVAFGQTNYEEENSREVIRVVRYSKDWERLGAASLYGANTAVPFYAGSLRMVQSGDQLYVRTTHQMYAKDGGVGYQANMMFSVHIPDMQISDESTGVTNVGRGYVSHSFNQFLAVDEDDNLIAADHGDAYPRSMVLLKYKEKAGMGSFSERGADAVNVLKFGGTLGDSLTGASLGGIAAMNGAYLTAGNSVDQGEGYTGSGTRNIFVTSTPRESFSAADTQIHWITNYGKGDGVSVSTPHLVKIDRDRALLLYTVDGSVQYGILDGNGNLIGKIQTTDGKLSDCAPVRSGNEVVWYYTDDSAPVFCAIDLDKALAAASPKKNSGSSDHAKASVAGADGWRETEDGSWYYVGSDGNTLTGWKWIADKNGVQKCYYLDPDSKGIRGLMAVNRTIDGSRVNADGQWVVDGVVQTR